MSASNARDAVFVLSVDLVIKNRRTYRKFGLAFVVDHR
jgi:hypothetical protein